MFDRFTRWGSVGDRLCCSLRHHGIDLEVWESGDRIIWTASTCMSGILETIEHGSTDRDLEGLSDATTAAMECAIAASEGRPTPFRYA